MHFGCEAIDFRHFLRDLKYTRGYLWTSSDRAYAWANLENIVPWSFITLMDKNHWDHPRPRILTIGVLKSAQIFGGVLNNTQNFR
jgi:hypothetical protein